MTESVGSRREIEFSKLILDTENPRLLDPQDSQRAAIRTMVIRYGSDILGLARHILSEGRDLSDLMKVVPNDENSASYIVLDGNRRLTAYRILETPALLPDELKPALAKKFRDLSKGFDGPPENELCVVYSSREEAYPFIELAHRGKQDGAGRTPWSGLAGARFDELTGKDVAPLELLRFTTRHGWISDEAREKMTSFPISTLERVINTPEAAKSLGLKIEGGKLFSEYPEREILKGLTRLVEDLALGRQNSRTLNRDSAREEYVKEFPSTSRPNPNTKLKEVVELGTMEKVDRPVSKKKSGRSREQTPRNKLVPRDAQIELKSPRLEQLFNEMKKVNINTMKNTAGVLLRVFLEWSVEEYIEFHQVKLGKKSKDDRQSRRLSEVVKHMKRGGIASEGTLKAIEVAISDRNSLINLETLHGYVHNRSFIPTAQGLRDSWDQLQEFFAILHGSLSKVDGGG